MTTRGRVLRGVPALLTGLLIDVLYVSLRSTFGIPGIPTLPEHPNPYSPLSPRCCVVDGDADSEYTCLPEQTALWSLVPVEIDVFGGSMRVVKGAMAPGELWNRLAAHYGLKQADDFELRRLERLTTPPDALRVAILRYFEQRDVQPQLTIPSFIYQLERERIERERDNTLNSDPLSDEADAWLLMRPLLNPAQVALLPELERAMWEYDDLRRAWTEMGGVDEARAALINLLERVEGAK